MRPRPAAVFVASLLAVTVRAAVEQVHIVGSGYTVRPLVERLILAHAQTSPDFLVSVEGEGTMWGPMALMSGRAQLAAMSRAMNPGELQVYRDRTGRDPLGFPIALDAVAIYVNAANPLERLSLPQVDAVFSAARRCGAEREARHWGDLALTGPWAERPIERIGRRAASGTGGYFQSEALCGGMLAGGVQLVAGGGAVAEAVAASAGAIGFGSFAARASGAKAISIALDDAAEYVAPEPAALRTGAYPLTRRLYLYANARAEADAGPTLDSRVAAFVAFALSDEGQAIAEAVGYVRLPETTLRESREALQRAD